MFVSDVLLNYMFIGLITKLLCLSHNFKILDNTSSPYLIPYQNYICCQIRLYVIDCLVLALDAFTRKTNSP